MNIQQFPQEFTTHRVKKHYRARGSRGGARKKKQAAARARAAEAQGHVGFLGQHQSSHFYPSASSFPHQNHNFSNGNGSSCGVVYPYQRHEDYRQLSSTPDARLTRGHKVHNAPTIGDDSHSLHPHYRNEFHVPDFAYESSRDCNLYPWNGGNAKKSAFRPNTSDESTSSSIPTVALSSSSSHSLACSEISDALSDTAYDGVDGHDSTIPKDGFLPSNEDLEEATILLTSSSASMSSAPKQRVIAPLVSSYSSTSSLFVTSPKSFLMGKTSTVVPAKSDELMKQRLTY